MQAADLSRKRDRRTRLMNATRKVQHATIRVGIGGWTYAPWRETFYPKSLTQSRELEYASRQFSAIEINSTFYRTQSASTFAKWHRETPENFRFSVKAPRFITYRSVLTDAGESINRFIESGLVELGDKLGPILWQFAPTKHFEPEEFRSFLALLPDRLGGRYLRHVLDVRHNSFLDAEFLLLARRHNAATVVTDSGDYPSFADVTSDFVYARLMRSESSIDTGYSEQSLDIWAQCARSWAAGKVPTSLPRVDRVQKPATINEVFIFVINGAKERAPAAARALLDRLNDA